MEMIPGVTVLITGSALGVVATMQMARWNPFGKLPFFVGNPDEYPFSIYMQRTLALFLILVGAALLYVSISSGGVFLAILSTVPMWLLTRDHNQQVDGDFGPE